MNEVFEQLNHYKWVLIHHRWLVCISAILISFIGWTAIQFIPNKYESDTRIYIDTETALKSLLVGIAVNNDVLQNAARVMERTLLIRSNLEKLVRETDLSLRIIDSDPGQMENLLEELAGDISITSIALARNDTRNIYSISYSHADPQLAKSVVDVLLNIFVETILGTSRKDTFSAQKFLDEQIDLYDQKQIEAEEKLKQFKQENSGIMMEMGTGFFASVNALETRIQETMLIIREGESRAQTLQKQIDDLLNMDSSSPSTVNLPMAPLDIRIDNLETRLDELLLHYTDLHPDVTATRRVLEELKQQKQDLTNEDSASPKVGNEVLNSNLYQELNVLLVETQAGISALGARLAEFQRRREEMDKVMLTMPTIEAQMTSLNRDYQVTRELYQDLVKRRESSQLSYKAEQTGEDLQFRILEPPRVPVFPASPNRILLDTMVMIAALGAGIGLALFSEQIRPTFYTKRQISGSLNIPVLGFVSIFLTEKEITRRRLGIGLFCIVILIWFLSYAGLLFFNGLDFGVPALIDQIIN